MNEEQMKELIDKRVFLETNTGRRYTGKVLSIENGFIKLLDKFNAKVYVSIDELNFIEEKT